MLVLSAPLGNLTYGEAARIFTQEKLQNAYEAIEKFDDLTLPHEAKDLRKEVLSAREMLDLFIFTFQDEKKILEFRKQLDSGYEIIGTFKDLYDSQVLEDPALAKYDKKSVQKRRNEVLVWKRQFLLQRNSFEAFLQKNLSVGSAQLKKKSLSNQFWGVSGINPQTQDLANKVLGQLLVDLWTTAVNEYETVCEIKDPGKDEKRIEVYHDFRKRLRSAIKIIQYFDEFSQQFPSETLQSISLLVSQYGVISDLIVKLELLDEKQDQKKIEKLHQKIKNQWKDIQVWEKSNNIDQVLNEALRAAQKF